MNWNKKITIAYTKEDSLQGVKFITDNISGKLLKIEIGEFIKTTDNLEEGKTYYIIDDSFLGFTENDFKYKEYEFK